MLSGFGEFPQSLSVLCREVAGFLVDDAQGSDGPPAGAFERVAGVETDVGLPGDQRIQGEPRIGSGVVDHEQALIADRDLAERDVPRQVLGKGSGHGFEELPVIIDQGDRRGADLETFSRQPGDPVEPLFSRAVQELCPGERV